jgi:F0F1-type ATP synthase membrane subunit b/b'
MGIVGIVVSIGAAIILLIFVSIFVKMVSKWGVKRTKEISKRFETELKSLQDKETELKEIRKQIVELRQKQREVVKKKDKKTVEFLDGELRKTERKRDKLLKDINENY